MSEAVEAARLRSFRKRPVSVRMIRWDGSDEARQVIRRHARSSPWLCGDHEREGAHDGALIVWVQKGGTHAHVGLGDWVALEPDGTGVYPVAADVFEATFEPSGPMPSRPVSPAAIPAASPTTLPR